MPHDTIYTKQIASIYRAEILRAFGAQILYRISCYRR